jgi:Bacterial type III secretion protein (HrpB4)
MSVETLDRLAVSTREPISLPMSQLACAIDAKCSSLARQLHAGWHAGVPAPWWQGGEPPVQRRRLAQASHALAALYGVRWPALGSLRPRVHRVAVLERGPLLRVLAAAVLYVRRFELRQVVSKSERKRLSEIVGEPTYGALLASAENGMPVSGAAPLASLGSGELAEAGYRAIAADGLWRCRHVLTLVRLALAPEATTEPPRATRARRGPLAGFEEQLHVFFPEYAWLFGSEMDRALSASKTA